MGVHISFSVSEYGPDDLDDMIHTWFVLLGYGGRSSIGEKQIDMASTASSCFMASSCLGRHRRFRPCGYLHRPSYQLRLWKTGRFSFSLPSRMYCISTKNFPNQRWIILTKPKLQCISNMLIYVILHTNKKTLDP